MATGSDPGFSSPHRYQTVFKKAPFSCLARLIVLNVYFKLRVEIPDAPYHETVRRVADLTGVGYATIFRWKKLVEKSALTGAPSVPSPIRTRRERPPATPSVLDSFHHQALRLIVHGFFRRNECPTLLKARFTFTTRKRNSLLLERNDLVLWRASYLRSIKEYRQDNRPIYYLDETWINAGHTRSKVWKDHRGIPGQERQR
ncbi:hypothetical protein HPB47_013297 [Ixodes persulcatus]|uniref:Uncharacterized protein n=1 Tax=Ixodes persulcatus TaxID=34615 RepID=A0AC60R256_IXOPE|nr:hypothetical protein HPB47_013297 [Ixodes persulcatus]